MLSLSMRPKPFIFSSDSIISTLNMNIEKDFDVRFEEAFNRCGAVSVFTVDHKDHERYCFMAETFENDENPNLIASFDVFSINDGDFKPLVEILHPKFKKLLSLVNRYITVFMIILGNKKIDKSPTINIHMDVKYVISESGELTLTDISLHSLIMNSIIIIRSLDEVTKMNIAENIENIVDNYLKKIGFTNIDEHKNFEELLNLVKMQKTVDDMALI
jgi:hypothetical protein